LDEGEKEKEKEKEKGEEKEKEEQELFFRYSRDTIYRVFFDLSCGL
jgi:hypothetical protein